MDFKTSGPYLSPKGKVLGMIAYSFSTFGLTLQYPNNQAELGENDPKGRANMYQSNLANH